MSIPLDDLPPVTSSSASAPVSSSPAASSSVQSAVKRLASAAVQSVVGKGRSAGKGKGKGPMKFTCIEPGCSYSTFNKGDFNIHMDKHRGIKYNCGSCDKSFGSTKSRDAHIRTVHLGQHRAVCPELNCNFSHNDHGVTRVHLFTKHGIGQAPKCARSLCCGRSTCYSGTAEPNLCFLDLRYLGSSEEGLTSGHT